MSIRATLKRKIFSKGSGMIVFQIGLMRWVRVPVELRGRAICIFMVDSSHQRLGSPGEYALGRVVTETLQEMGIEGYYAQVYLPKLQAETAS